MSALEQREMFSTVAGYDIKVSARKLWGMFGTMGNIFSFNSSDNASETALEVPDEAEEVDLKRHATRCALRYRSLKQGQTENTDRLRRIEIILLIGGAVYIATSQGAHDVIKGLLGF